MKSTRLFMELTPVALAARVPALAVGEPRSWRVDVAPGSAEDVGGRGWSTAQVMASSTTLLREAVEALHDADLPLVALYAFDAMWRLGADLAAHIGAALGQRYVLVSDFWTFRIPAGREGWPPHRGVYDVLDRKRPELINVWVALSDAAVDQSCMHFVPLGEDAAYRRGDLAVLDADGGLAAPVAAGTALFWNANVLHWGGACTTTASGPRVSATFTLQRNDVTHDLAVRAVPMTAWERIDAIAEQALTYAGVEDEALREWATIILQMKRGAGPSTR